MQVVQKGKKSLQDKLAESEKERFELQTKWKKLETDLSIISEKIARLEEDLEKAMKDGNDKELEKVMHQINELAQESSGGSGKRENGKNQRT